MLKSIRKQIMLAVTAAALAFVPLSAQAETRDSFRICWSIYVGWMPWGYIQDSGIMKKWADKYDIDVEIVQINDYIESINQYTAGGFDGCSMTNMDALTIPAVGGVDTTALIVGDFSNGNDGIVLKHGDAVADLKGREVNLVELSVSHYLLARALESVGLAERDLTVVNTSDADIVAAFASRADKAAVVTWNPQLSEVAALPGATKVFDSGDIPGEIIDLMVVNTETLADNPKLGKALVGAWYEMMALMRDNAEIRAELGEAAGTDLAGYEAQLATTRMFYEPGEAVSFTESGDLVATMDAVRKFSDAHGLLGEGGQSVDAVGIAFPGGKTLGDTGNIRLRFAPAFMAQAAAGGL